MSKIGFIGAGNMAEALIRGLITSRLYGKKDIIISDISKHRESLISKNYGVTKCKNNSELAELSDIIVLSVKPNNIGSVVKDISSVLSAKNILISIAAGIPTSSIKKALQKNVKVVRVMPNTPALVLEGASAIFFPNRMNNNDRKKVTKIFDAIGKAYEVDKESLMDGITALSGSGPAFVALFIEAMADAGVKTGLPRQLALSLASQTVLGTAKMIIEENIHPAVLKDRVSSPAGTTIEGLNQLELNGFRGTVISAVEAAAERSRELSQEVL